MSSKLHVRTDVSRPTSLTPKVSLDNVSGLQSRASGASPTIVRAKVNSIAQTGGLKARNLTKNISESSAQLRSKARSPSPQRAPRPRSGTNVSTCSSPEPRSPSVTSVRFPAAISRTPSVSSQISHLEPTKRTRTISAKSSLSSIARPPSPSKSPSSRVTSPEHSSAHISPPQTSGDGQSGQIRVKSKVSSLVKSRPLSTIFSAPESDASLRASKTPQRSGVHAFDFQPPRAPSPLRFQTHSRRTSLSQNSIALATSLPSSPPSPRIVVDVADPVHQPRSPPVSTVSFTSQSSTSISVSSQTYSPVSEHTSAPSQTGMLRARVELDRLPSDTSQESGVLSSSVGSSPGIEDHIRHATLTQEQPEDTVLSPTETEPDEYKTTAKTNRKIADLEITNKSLLTINANLESTKHRLTKELHELRKKLREARLALPPSRFRLLKSTDPDFERDLMEQKLENDNVRELLERVHGSTEGDEESGEEDPEEDVEDATFGRSLQLVQNMISAAQNALEAKIEVKGPGNNNIPRMQVLHIDDVERLEKSLEEERNRDVGRAHETITFMPTGPTCEQIIEVSSATESARRAGSKLDEHG